MQKNPVLAFAVLLALLPIGRTGRAASAETSASMQPMAVPSHGSLLLGVFYLAAGAEPHPTAILLHGIPGYEQNLDLAQALRARGWNVLALHYRGSWGLQGNFSYTHCLEDADAEVAYVLDPANARKYAIDTHHVIVIGHSMGGYMAAAAAAHNREVAGVVLISAWNIGATFKEWQRLGASVEQEGKALSGPDLLPLSGTGGGALAREVYPHPSEWEMNNFTAGIAPRPALVVTAKDDVYAADHAFAEALRKAGGASVAESHWDTDHYYSGVRAQLCDAVLRWAEALRSSPASH